MKIRTFKLNKLVRDKIVELNLSYGAEVDYITISGHKLNKALIDKLIEEAKEMKAEGLSSGELADLQEIIDQLAKNLGLNESDLKKKQTDKRKSNGGFKKGHFINTLTLPADHKWSKYYAADPKRFPEETQK